MDELFHDSQDSQENLSSQTVRENSDNNMDTNDSINSQEKEENDRTVKDLYGDLEPPPENKDSFKHAKSMENIQNTSSDPNLRQYRSEYATDVEKPLKLKIKRVEMPANVVKRLLNFQTSENTSEEERGAQSLLLQQSLKAAAEANNTLPTPPPASHPSQPSNTSISQSFFFLPPPLSTQQSTQNSSPSTSQIQLPPASHLTPNSRGLQRWSSQKDSAIRQEILGIVNKDNENFEAPKKTTKLKHLILQKTKATLKTNNKYLPLSDDSDREDESEEEDTQRPRIKRNKPNTPQKDKNNTQAPTKTKKPQMPPIVIDGVTRNHKQMVANIKETINGQFTVKHTNQSTILFVEDEPDYTRVLTNIRTEKIPHHTYTQKQDKSHAFVLRGMTTGTEIEDIKEDLQESYDIKAREIFLMTTKNRPLYLVITDPAITLEYLNKNGDFSVKHTNASTIIFVDDKDDHSRVLNNIKAEKLSYHTYTSSDDKSHAFVLRGLAEGTKIVDIEENLEDDHDIKVRNVYQMNTKERPLFLVV
ncbi:unnamed protein product [Psylliodes chrysocephalus]|uniref:Uncharacterized protein n=1 Tax=Psylliodes chrysocephalus TaxID=3402493 RepID=A0A9P0CIY3_9CUCU|nr:unnamed protein product [Psylliodes chrysocephala]